MDRPTRLPRPVAPDQSLAAALDDLLERTRERVRDGVRSEATLRMQVQHARYLLSRLDAETRLDELDEVELEHWVALERQGRRGKTLAAGTLKARLSTLRSAMRLALRRGRLVRLPAFPEIIGVWRPRRLFLRSFEEYTRLFESLPSYRADWMALCLWSAQHASDVDRMTWRDVDLDGEFSPRSSFLLRNTKNKRVEGLRVAMPRPLERVLRAKRERERPLYANAPIVATWSNRRHQLPLHARRLGLMIRAAIDLRHTLISWMVRRVGITPAVLAYAGHSSYQMASRVYAHAMQPQLHEVVAAAESMEHERRPAVSSTFCEEFERIDRDPDEGEPRPAAPATALGRAA